MEKLRILFLCTGNSCRSQMAESIVNSLYLDRFQGFSAGSKPDLTKYPETKGVHPMAIRILEDSRMRTEGLHSKSWDQYIKQREDIQFAFTLCDNAKSDIAEFCPVFPGQPMTAHWGLPDPALATGTDEEIYKAFKDAFATVRRRIDLMANLPFQTLKKHALQQQIEEIGQS